MLASQAVLQLRDLAEGFGEAQHNTAHLFRNDANLQPVLLQAAGGSVPLWVMQLYGAAHMLLCRQLRGQLNNSSSQQVVPASTCYV